MRRVFQIPLTGAQGIGRPPIQFPAIRFQIDLRWRLGTTIVTAAPPTREISFNHNNASRAFLYCQVGNWNAADWSRDSGQHRNKPTMWGRLVGCSLEPCQIHPGVAVPKQATQMGNQGGRTDNQAEDPVTKTADL